MDDWMSDLGGDFDWGSMDFGGGTFDFGGGGGSSDWGGVYDSGMDFGGGDSYAQPDYSAGYYGPGTASTPAASPMYTNADFSSGEQSWYNSQPMYNSAGNYRAPAQYSPALELSRGANTEAMRQMYPSSGGGGPRGLAAQPLQTNYLGAPERTMYDLYTGMLKDPSKLAENPAYKFLFNQGQQALERSNAAKRLRFSGKSLADSTAFGEGMASDFANRMLPQYAAGAESELRRFMGPAGLIPQYQAGNNAAIGQAGAAQGAQDMMPFYQQMMSQLAGGRGTPSYSQPAMPAGPSFGGVRGGYDYTPRLEQAWGNQDNTGMFAELGL